MTWHDICLFLDLFLGVYTSICLGPDSLQKSVLQQKIKKKVGLGLFENISITFLSIKT